MGLSVQHLLLTLVIVILVFGTKRLKNIGGDLGDAIKGFRSAMKEGSEDKTLSEKGNTANDESVAQKEKDQA